MLKKPLTTTTNMKKAAYILTIVIVAMVSYYIGGHDIFMAKDVHKDGSLSMWYPHSYSYKEALKYEREVAFSAMECLHRFYGSDDNDTWFESFMKTKEYIHLDSVLGGEWEDFYSYEDPMLEDWYSVYGTEYEPTQAYKDSVQYGLINPRKQ